MPSSPAREHQQSLANAARPTAELLHNDSILRPADAVAWVVVEQEVVLYDARTATSYVLNPTAALLWRCLDGQSAVGEIVGDMAAVFEVDPATIGNDVAPILSAWDDDDLVTQDQP